VTLDDIKTWDQWMALSEAPRVQLRDFSGLTEQLRGLEGCRVEVVDRYGETRRFNVGRSTGWRPCHLELRNRASRGGDAAHSRYDSVRIVRRVH
jgi:hypothetical protein